MLRVIVLACLMSLAGLPIAKVLGLSLLVMIMFS
jgi:hypothetical protein